MPEFVAVQCCSCESFQVTSVKKNVQQFTCPICQKKQSIVKIFAKSNQAKDIRGVVQQLNLARGQAAEASTKQLLAKAPAKVEKASESVSEMLSAGRVALSAPPKPTITIARKEESRWKALAEEEADNTTGFVFAFPSREFAVGEKRKRPPALPQLPPQSIDPGESEPAPQRGRVVAAPAAKPPPAKSSSLLALATVHKPQAKAAPVVPATAAWSAKNETAAPADTANKDDGFVFALPDEQYEEFVEETL